MKSQKFDALKTPIAVVILAAGQGKRMRSETPKVLFEISGEPMLFSILRKVQEKLSNPSVALVVGVAREKVEAAVRAEMKPGGIFENLKIEFVIQEKPLGTGDALKSVMTSRWGKAQLEKNAALLVLPGDQPLISGGLLRAMTEKLKTGAVLRLLSVQLERPEGYGRIVRTKNKVRIVEEKDATAAQKKIKEVAVSTYFFNSKFLEGALQRLRPKNAQGEYYLTDVLEETGKSTGPKKAVELLNWESAEDVLQVNNPWELAQVRALKNRRLIEFHAMAGVQFSDPQSVQIDRSVEIDEAVKIGPSVELYGKTRVGRGSRLDSRVALRNVDVRENVHLKTGTFAEDARIEAGAKVGPYAHLRPESVVGADCKIGNFVELKKTTLGARTSVAHLSYLGDATVGSDCNIGCGFVTCNFDGRVIDGERKHRTIIEDGVFMGSDCQTVAPVKVGRGAYVASGSTITQDVPAEGLAIARSRQVNKEGYAKRLREMNPRK